MSDFNVRGAKLRAKLRSASKHYANRNTYLTAATWGAFLSIKEAASAAAEDRFFEWFIGGRNG